MSLDTTESVILPLFIEELEEVILDSLLVRLAHEVVEKDLEVRFTGVRSSVVRVTRVLGSLWMQPWISAGLHHQEASISHRWPPDLGNRHIRLV